MSSSGRIAPVNSRGSGVFEYTQYKIAGTLVGNSRPNEPDAVSNPIEKFSGYRVLISIGTSKPPSDRMVRPEPAKVKTVQMATVAIARPPGIQLKSAVKTCRR